VRPDQVRPDQVRPDPVQPDPPRRRIMAPGPVAPDGGRRGLAERVHEHLVRRDPATAAERSRVLAAVRAEDPLLPLAAASEVAGAVAARVEGLGPVEDLLADPAVSEVMVNGPGRVWVERAGRLEATAGGVDRGRIAPLL
jgi:hypothetical protein